MATYETNCVQCGKRYTAERKTSKFCSDKCRQNNHRQHTDNINTSAELYKALDALRNLEHVSVSELMKNTWHIEKILEVITALNNKVKKPVR